MASFEQRESGYWQAKIRRKGHPAQSRTFRTKAEAEAWARGVENEMDRGVFISRAEAEATTLKECLDRYAREITPQKKGAAKELSLIKKLSDSPLAKKCMASIRGTDLATFRDEQLRIGYSPKTVLNALALLSSLFNKARKEWGMESLANPVQAISKPRVKNDRDRRLSVEEEERLLRALEDHAGPGKKYRKGSRNPWIKPVVLLALETAMRRGEILGLRWEHVDLKRRFVHLPDTKNGTARDVPLSSRAVTVLEGLPRSIDGRVFPVTGNAVHLAWERAVARAQEEYREECQAKGLKSAKGFLEDLRFHDLRHEATSRLAEKLSNILELSSVTGHKDLRMLKRYYHPRAEDLARKLG